jgi:hypothetical protein
MKIAGQDKRANSSRIHLPSHGLIWLCSRKSTQAHGFSTTALRHSPNTRRRCSSRISSAMLARDSPTSSPFQSDFAEGSSACFSSTCRASSRSANGGWRSYCITLTRALLSTSIMRLTDRSFTVKRVGSAARASCRSGLGRPTAPDVRRIGQLAIMARNGAVTTLHTRSRRVVG